MRGTDSADRHVTVRCTEMPYGTPAQLANLRPPWQPGESGNPGGRPQGAVYPVEHLKSMATMTADELQRIFDDPTQPATRRAAADMALQAVDTAAIWIERSARVGAKIGIQHPTTNRFDAELEGMDLYIRQLGKSIEELLPVADRLGYTIALENLPPSENGYRFSSLPEHFEAMIRAFHHPNLGFILDTGHALISRGREHADEFH